MQSPRQPSPLVGTELSHLIAILLEVWGCEYQIWQTRLSRLDARGLDPRNGSACDEVGPGGRFLGCEHTVRIYQNSLFEPEVSSNDIFFKLEEAGAEEMRLCALKRWHTFLEQYDPLPLDVAVREALDAFVTQPEASMPDIWYLCKKIW